RRIDDEPWVLYASHELTNCYLGLQPRQRATETEMDTTTKAEVLVVPAFDVYFVGVLEAVGVAICRSVHYDNWRSLRNYRSRELDIFERGARRPELDR